MQLDTTAALALALAAKNVKNFKKGRPQCTHCGVMGHVVDKCYKLHGYPPGYKFKSTKGQVAATLPPFANNVIAPEDNASGGVSLTKSEYQQLLSLLNSDCHFGTQGPSKGATNTHQVANIITQPSFDLQGHEISGIWFVPSLEYSVFSSSISTSHIQSTDWILDNGATDHMIHSLAFFTSITYVVQISVRLLNGDMTKVTHIGIGQLSSTLILDNMVCIPSFSFNLISISKLT